MAAPVTGATASTATEPAVVKETRGGKTVYRIETPFVVEGRIQKPNAFYVLQRQAINYQWGQLQGGFLGRIAESVNGDPF